MSHCSWLLWSVMDCWNTLENRMVENGQSFPAGEGAFLCAHQEQAEFGLWRQTTMEVAAQSQIKPETRDFHKHEEILINPDNQYRLGVQKKLKLAGSKDESCACFYRRSQRLLEQVLMMDQEIRSNERSF
ncbi:hypothetical protein MHYP_G00110970 [Metynnis hypsauchen]